METESYYQATAPWSPNAPLSEAINCDTVIVGAGFAGLATAMGMLERGHKDVVVLEAQQVGHGASGRNGGFIFGGFSLGEEALLKQHGPERARQLYQFTLDGGDLMRSRIERYQLDCDLNNAGVLLTDWFGDDEALRAKQRLMKNTYGVDWEWMNREEVRTALNTDRYACALLEPKASHFHPLKYCQGLARVLGDAGVKVFENSRVTSVCRERGEYSVSTPQGRVKARQVVIAGGGYIHGLDLPITKAILPIATYVAATEPLGDRLKEYIRGDWAIYDTRFAFDYYRPLADTRILWGGRISIRRPDAITLNRWLRRDLSRVFPELGQSTRFEYVWHGLMGYMRHKMPYIQESQPGLWHVIGFGGHGVAPTTGLGELVAATLTQDEQRAEWFQQYGMPHAYGSAGSLAAQLTYWYLQSMDAIKDWRYRNRRHRN